MITRLSALVPRFAASPRRLFLVDGLGALLTAGTIGGVLVKFASDIGLPRFVLYSLSTTAGVLAIYSLSYYFFVSQRWRSLLRVIAGANLAYCGITAALMIYFYAELSVLGWAYFVGEIAIVAGLALFELNVAAVRVNEASSV